MTARRPTRRLALATVLLLAACATPPPRVYPALSYDYLLPLRLNVASIDVRNDFLPSNSDEVSALSPVPPANALMRMAHDRLFAAGTTGRAVFVIDTASILRTGGALYGALAVHLDILAADGSRTAFAEARVARTVAGQKVDDDLDGALYGLTRQMMDDMNVEFEYQVRRALKDWLQPPAGPAAPVRTQPLPPAPPQ
jgi:hypothetical protein